MASLLLNTALQGLLVGALLGGGQLALRWCGFERRRRSHPAAEVPWPVLLAAGLVWWGALLFVLATFGLYRPILLRTLTLCAAAAGALVLVRRRLRNEREPRELPPLEPEIEAGVANRLVQLVALGTCVLILATLWLQAHRPDLSWDANVYHLEVPKRLLQAGGWRAFDWNVYGNWPHPVQLVWGTALAWGRHEGAKLLHWTFAVATVVLIARLGRRASSKPAVPDVVLAGILFLSHPVVLYEARIAYVDLAHGLLVLAAFWAVEHWCGGHSATKHTALELGAGASARDLRLIGLLVAGVLTVKLSGFLGAGSLLLSWLVGTRRRSPGQLLPILLPSLVLGAAWLGKTAYWTGNPFHPLLWRRFGGPNWSLTLADQHAAWQQSMGPGRGLIDWLLLPWRVLTQGGRGYEHFDGQLGLILLVALPLALIGARRDSTARRALIIVTLMFVGWAATSQQMRLLLPALPLLCVAMLRGLDRLRLQTRRIATGVVLATGIVGLASSSWIYVQQAPRLTRDLLTGGSALRRAVVPSEAQWIDRELEATDRILLLGTNRAFFLHPEVIADSFFEASQIRWTFRDCLEASEALDLALELGATHLLWAAPAERFPYPEGLRQLVVEARTVDAVVFANDRAELVDLQRLSERHLPRSVAPAERSGS